jgi:hypothetical protein
MSDLSSAMRVAGLAIVALGIGHAWLPRELGWPDDLSGSSLLTRQIATVHSAYIGLTCVLLGAIPAFAPELLLAPSPLAIWVLTGLVAFWGSRFGVQLWVYDASLWRGNVRLTAVHVAYAGFWAVQTLVYGLALTRQLS